jgi:hypothetical protein
MCERDTEVLLIEGCAKDVGTFREERIRKAVPRSIHGTLTSCPNSHIRRLLSDPLYVGVWFKCRR